jgi:hypothetical protein
VDAVRPTVRLPVASIAGPVAGVVTRNSCAPLSLSCVSWKRLRLRPGLLQAFRPVMDSSGTTCSRASPSRQAGRLAQAPPTKLSSFAWPAASGAPACDSVSLSPNCSGLRSSLSCTACAAEDHVMLCLTGH